MTELRECPFCGGKAEIKTYLDDNEFNIWGGSVMCTRCGISYDVGICSQDTIESELVHLWNDRYEPTCKVRQSGYATGFCGHCGAEFMASVVNNQPPDYVESAHHCPNCGCRIVEVDE